MKASKYILVLGAGRSSASLIRHLLSQADNEQWDIHVGDLNVEAAMDKVGGHPR